jgi:hypothetical protein
MLVVSTFAGLSGVEIMMASVVSAATAGSGGFVSGTVAPGGVSSAAVTGCCDSGAAALCVIGVGATVSLWFVTCCISATGALDFHGARNLVEFADLVFPIEQLFLPQHLMILPLLDIAVFDFLVTDRYLGALIWLIFCASI